jgi:hypothetical protein
MTIFKKYEVKSHPSLRVHARTSSSTPLRQPDATDRSLTGPDPTRSIASTFADDYSGEHTIAGTGATPAANSIDAPGRREPKVIKRAQP